MMTGETAEEGIKFSSEKLDASQWTVATIDAVRHTPVKLLHKSHPQLEFKEMVLLILQQIRQVHMPITLRNCMVKKFYTYYEVVCTSP